MKLDTITVRFIHQKEQRYLTWGDYWWSAPGILEVRITRFPDWRKSFGILLHELFEFALVVRKGISMKAIDDFDRDYKGSDPGTNPLAPYHREHMDAMEIEEMFYAASEYQGTIG